MKLDLELPLRLVSEANRASHEHWSRRHRRASEQRAVTRMAVCGAVLPRVPVANRVEVTIVRLSARRLDDDNLVSACKAVRDGVADAFGVSDRDPRFLWRYAQERRHEPGVRISVELPDVAARALSRPSESARGARRQPTLLSPSRAPRAVRSASRLGGASRSARR